MYIKKLPMYIHLYLTYQLQWILLNMTALRHRQFDIIYQMITITEENITLKL